MNLANRERLERMASAAGVCIDTPDDRVVMRRFASLVAAYCANIARDDVDRDAALAICKAFDLPT